MRIGAIESKSIAPSDGSESTIVGGVESTANGGVVAVVESPIESVAVTRRTADGVSTGGRVIAEAEPDQLVAVTRSNRTEKLLPPSSENSTTSRTSSSSSVAIQRTVWGTPPDSRSPPRGDRMSRVGGAAVRSEE